VEISRWFAIVNAFEVLRMRMSAREARDGIGSLMLALHFPRHTKQERISEGLHPTCYQTFQSRISTVCSGMPSCGVAHLPAHTMRLLRLGCDTCHCSWLLSLNCFIIVFGRCYGCYYNYIHAGCRICHRLGQSPCVSRETCKLWTGDTLANV
jgi:hypothetical protein